MKVQRASSQKKIDVRIRDTKKLKGGDFDQQGFINDIYLKNVYNSLKQDEVLEKLVKRLENGKGESDQKENELKNLKGQMQNAQGTNFFKYLK